MSTISYIKPVRRENNDCSVVAVALGLDISYEDAHSKLKALGRKDGGRFDLIPHLEILGLEEYLIHILMMDNTIYSSNPNRISEIPPIGRYIVVVPNHYFNVIDGVVHDFKVGAQRHVRYVLKKKI